MCGWQRCELGGLSVHTAVCCRSLWSRGAARARCVRVRRRPPGRCRGCHEPGACRTVRDGAIEIRVMPALISLIFAEVKSSLCLP
eukprot:3091022-Prymnesium_polylepis.2